MSGRSRKTVETVAVELPAPVAQALGRRVIVLGGSPADQLITAHIRKTRRWEPHVMEVIAEKLPVGGTFVDVGANIGVHSVLGALRVGPSGMVVAVEAAPVNFAFLAANLASTGCPRALAINRGVWDTQKTMMLRQPTPEHTNFHIAPGENWSGQQIEIPCETLDAILAGAGANRVDMIKIDAEGSEFRILQGAKESLAKYRPAMVVEFCPATLSGVSCVSDRDLYDWIRTHGYRLTIVHHLPPFRIPITDHSVLEHWWSAGHTLADVLCEPEGE